MLELPTPARCSALRACAPCAPPKSLAELAQGGVPTVPFLAKAPTRKADPGATGGAPRPGADTAVAPRDTTGRMILCAACKHPITRTDAAFSVAGSHEHTFMNPGGLVFEIACYREAPGALEAGPSSPEWSWFPGHVWRVALCGGCREHLGWSFRREAASFFGLVSDRIAEAEGPEP